jgi:N-dimethylarginine dimethylaminohydrolase
MEGEAMGKLDDLPGYQAGSVPQYYEYHSEVDFLDEIEAIWGQKWGAQGIGALREVAMSIPTEMETAAIFKEDPSFFLDSVPGGNRDLPKMQDQVRGLMETYRGLGVKVREMTYPPDAHSAYGPLKRSISVAAAFVINGGAILGREAAPYSRGRSRYIAEFLISIGCPILYTIHGKGVAAMAGVRMADDFVILMLSTDMNQEAIDQIRPLLERAGYRIWVAHSPGPLYEYHPEVPGWCHPDMWIAPLDRDLALIYPPWCDFNTIRYLKEIGYRLIEAPRAEQERVFPVNMITLEPGRVIMTNGAPETKRLIEAEGVEAIEVEYDEVVRYGGSIRCTTMQLVRDPGPRFFEP